jgi:RNA recognition motif-containing protein
MNIYVGNLPYSVTREDLEELFGEYGEVSSVNVISDRATGQSKGFGFVEMPQAGEAQEAISQLNGKEYKGRALTVNESRPRSERPQRSRTRW